MKLFLLCIVWAFLFVAHMLAFVLNAAAWALHRGTEALWRKIGDWYDDVETRIEQL